MTYLDYVGLNGFQRFIYRLWMGARSILLTLLSALCAIPRAFIALFQSIGKQLRFADRTMANGDAKTRLSFLVMGFSNFARGQIIKGLLFLATEAFFLYYFVSYGFKSIAGLATLGTQTQHLRIVEGQVPKLVPGDNSMLMLLYGVMGLVVVFTFIIFYFVNLSSAVKAQELEQRGERLPDFKTDVQSFLDEKFHVTLLALPVFGVIVFTILPLLFMILIAFTNYDSYHQPPGNLFHWSGLHSFEVLFGVSSASGLIGATFFPVLGWTFIWAFFSTITNYIFGMLLAMLINKKGVRCKGLFRTVFILSMAIPQFVSLLVFRTMLDDHGPINGLLIQLGLIHNFIPFLSDPTMARIMVLVVNLWIGIPYTMLITTGILMNIPGDLYEAARIDGASSFTIYLRITLPYMLFVTTPYLITQFVGNFNNFNVIYLLTGGNPATLSYYQAGKTDLLVTWLYKLTVNTRDYCFASAIGIFVFVLSAVFSLIAYHHSSSYNNEEAFQ